MNSTRTLILAVGMCALALGTASADKGDVERFNQLGRDAWRARNYLEAASAFEKAYAAGADPKYLYNAGKAYEMAGRFVTAIERFEGYLAEQPEAANAQAVETTIKALWPKAEVTHHRVRFESEPLGARIVIGTVEGGELTAPGRTWLPHGEHRLKAESPGHLPAERTFTVGPDEEALVRVRLVAEDAPGRIRFDGAEDGSRVEVDGTGVGVAPLAASLEVPPGRRKVSVITSDGRTFTAELSVAPGEEIAVQVALPQPVTPEPPPVAEPIALQADSGAGFEMPVSAWVTGGASVAAGATAIALYVLAEQGAADAESYSRQGGADQSVWQRKVDDAEGLLLGSEISAGVAGAAAVATGIILAVVNTDDEPSAMLIPAPIEGGGAFVLSFTH